MKHHPSLPGDDLQAIDRAVLTAAGLVRDFGDSTRGRALEPMQALTVLTIVAFDHALTRGADRRRAAAKLRELADALDQA